MPEPTTAGPAAAASEGAPSPAEGGREFPATDETARADVGIALPDDAPTAAAEPDSRPGEPAIDVRGLGIRYNLRLTRRTTLKGSLPGFLGRTEDEAPRHFWALRHVSFRLEHGESLAIIGPNGAGKSTLLLALAGILEPSEGEILTYGRVSTLLTLGAGFEQELSGRDNIDLVAAFLGIDHREMAALTPSIVEFADIGPFIDAPVKTYSTGMKARLGFAIATAITPDILLLDEVLGTGDQTFRARSQARIRELVDRAKAIVLVTHDLTSVTEFCNRAILVERGQIISEGPPADVVKLYRDRVAERKLLAETEAERFAQVPRPR
jgi:ABC-type polysaccharide/polyol phosphate transport system ATPase subunit